MSHTRGPWTIEYENDEGDMYEDGVRIDSPEGPVAFNVIECSANVIAAAPDLLAALKDVCRFESVIEGMNPSVWPVIHAAIAKAEGRPE